MFYSSISLFDLFVISLKRKNDSAQSFGDAIVKKKKIVPVALKHTQMYVFIYIYIYMAYTLLFIFIDSNSLLNDDPPISFKDFVRAIPNVWRSK